MGSHGLFTGVSPDVAPPGSLAQAYGLVCKKPGWLQKQRPFRQYADGAISTWNGQPSGRLGYYLGRLLVTDAAGKLFRETATGSAAFSSVGGTIAEACRQADANGNTYLLGPANAGTGGPSCGLAKLDAAGASLREAGVPRALDLYLTEIGGGTLLAVGQSVAYRATLYIQDANGNRVTGAPSGRSIWTATGANKDVSIKMFLPQLVINAGNGTSYRWQIWRSKVFATGVTPDDELQLVADYGISSTDIANKYVTFSDSTPDAMRAAALYTNPSQEGVAFSNDPPPVAQDIAFFKSFMLYANTYQKHRAILQVLGVPEEWAIQSIAANSPAAGQSTYTFLAGVDLAGFDHTFKLAVLNSTAAANDGTWAIAAYTSGAFVDGIDNTNHKIVVTNAGVAQAGVAGTAISGKMVVGNTTYYPIYGAESEANKYFTVGVTSPLATRIRDTAASLLRIVNQNTSSNVVGYCAVDDPLAAPGKILFEEVAINGSAFTVYALGTSTAAYVNAYYNKFAPTIAQAAPLTSLNDSRGNRVHYSKFGQPEHTPIPQYLDIGSRAASILRIIALRDAVLVFKQDGLFRITTDGVNLFWSVLDPTQFLLGANLVNTLHNVAVAVTSRGVWLFSEAGAEYVSGPVQDLLDKCIGPVSTGSYPGRNLSDPLSSAESWLSVSPNDGLVYLYINPLVSVSITDAVGLVYSLQTRVWTQQWASTGGSATADGVTGQVNFAELAFVVVNGMRIGMASNWSSTTYDIYAEDQYNLTGYIFAEYAAGSLSNQATAEPVPGHKYLLHVTAVVAGPPITITAAICGGPVLAVGTYVRGSDGAIYRISVLSPITLVSVYGNPGGLATGYWYFYSDQPAQWEYLPFSAEDDSAEKIWLEARLSLDKLSTISANSISALAYTEGGTAAAAQVSVGPPAVPSKLARFGTESIAGTGRSLSVRFSHQNKLEYLYVRGVSYLWEPVEDDRADV